MEAGPARCCCGCRWMLYARPLGMYRALVDWRALILKSLRRETRRFARLQGPLKGLEAQALSAAPGYLRRAGVLPRYLDPNLLLTPVRDTVRYVPRERRG